MSEIGALALAIVLLAGNAFFVGAEFALISARRTQIEPRAATGSRRARLTLRAMERVSLMMAGAQLGITVCSLGLGALGEPAVARLLERPLEAWGVPDAVLHPLAFTIALTLVVCLHMVIGEMVPKNIALAGPETSAVVLGPILYGIVVIFRPLIWLLNQLANLVLRVVRVQPKDEITSAFTREEVAGLIAQSRREGLLDEHEHTLLTGALDFVDRPVGDVTIPPKDLVTVPGHSTPAELEHKCATTGYSRFPVLAENGDLTGYVHTKDILGLSPDDWDEPLEPTIIRPLATVTTEQSLRDVLPIMQNQGAHLTRVVDPSTGELRGLATLEDILEELVGEVRDATQG